MNRGTVWGQIDVTTHTAANIIFSGQLLNFDVRLMRTSFVYQLSGEVVKNYSYPAESVILCAENVVIHRNVKLSIGVGSTVLLERNVEVLVFGTLESKGSRDSPVSWMAANRDKPWGGIAFVGGHGLFLETFIIEGGSHGQRLSRHRLPPFGHQKDAPIVSVGQKASFSCNGCYIFNCVGQGITGRLSAVTLKRTLLTGLSMGTELYDCTVKINSSLLTEFPTAERKFADNDNDAFYGVGGTMSLFRSVFSFAKDDCFDSGTGSGGDVIAEDCLFENCFHEGVAITNKKGKSKHVVIRNCTFSGNQQGIELGWSTTSTQLTVSDSLFSRNQVAARFGDNYGAPINGYMTVNNCSFYGNVADVLILPLNKNEAVNASSGHVRCRSE